MHILQYSGNQHHYFLYEKNVNNPGMTRQWPRLFFIQPDLIITIRYG